VLGLLQLNKQTRPCITSKTKRPNRFSAQWRINFFHRLLNRLAKIATFWNLLCKTIRNVLRTAKSNRYERLTTNCHHLAAGFDWCAIIYHAVVLVVRPDSSRNPKLICASVRMYRCGTGAEEVKHREVAEFQVRILPSLLN